jgi:hypothetical protein
MTTGALQFSSSLTEKLRDINTPGFVARLTPDEADEVFFEEPALSDDDGLADSSDLLDALE